MPTNRVDDAFAAVDRRDFLPVAERTKAGEDRPIPIGDGQTNSQPTTVRNMLQMLDVRLGDRVLDVGSGSGWTTALLAHLVGPTGQVIGVELVPRLAHWGAANLAGHGLPWATIQTADPGVLGVPEAGAYDRILVSAGADVLPAALTDQLRLGGVLVIPVAHRMVICRRRADGGVDVEHRGHYAFVPLVSPPP